MQAEQSLREGNLEEALARLQEQVRGEPASAKLRVFLFQLLCVLGRWDRALAQLQVAGDLDAGTLAMVQTYREAIRCEALRGEVFAGRRSPLVFGEPEPWLALLLEALRLASEGCFDEAAGLRARAFDAAPATAGTLDGEPFEWIADADGRLGPVLEAVVRGRYYWVPFHRLAAVHVEEPSDLRDLVWAPAHFAWANGGEDVGLIPTRYAGSEASPDAPIRLARRTEWAERAPDLYVGLGQRMLATDRGEHPLLDIREIRFAAAGPSPGRGADG